MQVVDTTKSEESDRFRYYVNGTLQRTTDASTYPTINQVLNTNGITYEQVLGRRGYADSNPIESYFFDWFLVDGQALTPDVFGFYKQGKGYISAGSTQATDFRPGQWVPKTPRVIKTEINRRGGFGVNGFYLPMNDSSNFGADFHGEPNSIITLNEKLPQPRVGVASTAAVGLGYTDVLRADPYAANLVLAIPGVIDGQGSGYGDYSANIKGSGTNKTVTANGNAGVAVTASYYGSALSFDGSGDYLSIANNSDFGLGSNNFTIEYWLYHNAASSSAHIFDIRSASDEDSVTAFYASSTQLRIYLNAADKITVSSELKQNQWTHHAIVRNGSTLTFYQNGVAAGINTTSGDTLRSSAPAVIGAKRDFTSALNGYLQDFRIYKGVAKYTGGFDVPRPYTPVGIATWRQVPDTTANNFATLNPLIEARPSSGTDSPASSTIVTFAGGNLDLTNSASSGNAQRMYSFATIGISTGRWYWEVRAGSNDAVAITKGFQQKNYAGPLGSGSGLEASVGYYGGGSVSIANTAYYSTATTLTPPSYNTTNIIGIAVSANSGLNNLTVQWFKDGVGVSTVTGIGATSPVLEWFPSRIVSSSGSGGDTKYNFGQNPTFSGNTTVGTFTDSNGKGLFKYQPPSDFLALCEDNLPTPAISDPGKYFKTVLYTGDGNSGRSIVGVGFTCDLVWIKLRDVSQSHYIFDSVRGAATYIQSDGTGAEVGITSSLTSFNSDGFSYGNFAGGNYNTGKYVAWCWRAGAGTTSTNTNGSITSVVSVNQDAGFSVVSYTGTGSAGTVGHGLGKAPSFIIIKRRSGISDWAVYHKTIGTTGALLLNSTSATDTNRLPYWNDTVPTITTLGLGNGNNVNASSSNYIAYCWAEIENFSKFGSYVGNGNADGPFVYCGFKPAWVMIKNVTDASGWFWAIGDSSRSSTNPDGAKLFANNANVEDTASYPIDYLSNGFKIRTTQGTWNLSASTHIFAAFAESPFQTANSK
jgi:hypothetical protein